MNCPNCNREIKDNAMFCPSCGAALRNNAVDAKVFNKRSKKKVFVILIGSMLLLAAIASALVFLSPKSSLNEHWKMTGYLEGSSGGLSIDLPTADLVVSEESFEISIAGEHAVGMFFGVGGSDPIDLTIRGTLSLVEETTEEKKYRVALVSVDPSEEMLESLKATYGSEKNGVSLEDAFSENIDTVLAESGKYTMDVCIPANESNVLLGDSEWYLEITDAEGLMANYGVRFIVGSDNAGSFQVYSGINKQEEIINEGTWSLSESNQIVFSFPYSDTDAGLAHISLTRESD